MKKRKQAEGGAQDRWVVSYAVFMTLLFALFVVMYALSIKDVAQARKAAQSIRMALGGPAILPGTSGLRESSNLSPFNAPAASAPASCPPCVASSEEHAELDQMQTLLEAAAKVEAGHADLGERMETLVDRRGLVIRLSANDFFAPSEAAVHSDLLPLLDRIGRVVSRSKRPVRIEGYSDGGERLAPEFASGWELSAARAAWVARYWIKRFNLDPSQVAVVGYAHYRPAPAEGRAESEWARARNRRIEVVVEK